MRGREREGEDEDVTRDAKSGGAKKNIKDYGKQFMTNPTALRHSHLVLQNAHHNL